MPTSERSRRRHAGKGRVDWAKVDATTEDDIVRQIAEDPDTAPELTEEALDRAVIVARDGTRTPYRERVPRSPESGVLEPGSSAPVSGIYQVVGPRGRSAGPQCTVAKGEPLPPTPRPDQGYRLVPSAERKVRT